MAIEGFYDPGALSGADWWGRNAPEFLGGVASGYGDTDTGGDASAPGGGNLVSALQGASKAFDDKQQQGGSQGPSGSPNVGGTAQVVGARSNALTNLLQLLMARQQAYQQAAVPGGGMVAQNARTQQPGLLGI